MSRTGGAAGHVTGTVTLGGLRSAPHHVHLAGPPAPSSWFLWTLDISVLRVLVAQAPGTRRPATADVSQVLGAILTPAPVSTLQIGQAPNSFFLVSMYWQISGTGAHTPP